jgi:hypothetical protein
MPVGIGNPAAWVLMTAVKVTDWPKTEVDTLELSVVVVEPVMDSPPGKLPALLLKSPFAGA